MTTPRTSPTITGLHAVAVPVSDQDRTLALLQRLGLETRFDADLPARVDLPENRTAAIDYDREVPAIQARAQHLFGMASPPRLMGGRIPLQVSLLSPAGRPIAVTSDLQGFWRGGWAEVRREMRGRYPRHAWPEDPGQGA